MGERRKRKLASMCSLLLKPPSTLVDVKAGEEKLKKKENEAKEEKKRIHQYVGKVERAFKELRERYDLRKAENAKLLWVCCCPSS